MKRTVIVVLALVFGAAIAFSQDPPPMSPMGFGHMAKIVKELKLTEDQQKEFDKLKFDLQKSMIAQVAKIATARVDLQQMLKADNPDNAAVNKKIDEMGDLVAQVGKTLVGQWFAVNKILTPEQQKVWKKALDIGPMMRHMMGGRGMGAQMGGRGPAVIRERIEMKENPK